MSVNCLVGCIGNAMCKGRKLNTPPDYDVLAPWVRATFLGGQPKPFFITVGNKSAPGRIPYPNNIVINSFEYGHTDGIELKFEIIDEQGGAFGDFVHNMVKCAKKADELVVKVAVEWGWIGQNCDGTHNVEKTRQPVYATLQDLEVNFTEGKFKYNITCKDVMNMLFSTKEDCIYGEDGKPMHLKDAIIDICNHKPRLEVEFRKMDANGEIIPDGIEWDQGGKRGPKQTWAGSLQDRLSTIRSWLDQHRMKPLEENRQSGVVVVWDSEHPNKIIIQQEVKPMKDCKSAANIGTFIVNGGKCSNVLEFSPKMNYAAAWAQFGTGGASGSSNTAQQQDADNPNEQDNTELSGDAGKMPFQKKHNAKCTKAGVKSETVGDERNRLQYPPKDVDKNVGKANQEHARANARFEQLHTISAEMRIVGDPRPEMVDPTKKGTLTCSIVVINPFHLVKSPFAQNQNDNACGDWLAEPGCNPVLTNRAWRIMGVNHIIKEGSYVTTVKLFLEAPGTDIPDDRPTFGAEGGDFIVQNLC